MEVCINNFYFLYLTLSATNACIGANIKQFLETQMKPFHKNNLKFFIARSYIDKELRPVSIYVKYFWPTLQNLRLNIFDQLPHKINNQIQLNIRCNQTMKTQGQSSKCIRKCWTLKCQISARKYGLRPYFADPAPP